MGEFPCQHDDEVKVKRHAGAPVPDAGVVAAVDVAVAAVAVLVLTAFYIQLHATSLVWPPP